MGPILAIGAAVAAWVWQAAPPPAMIQATAQAPIERAAVLSTEDWMNQIRSDDYWRKRRSQSPASQASDDDDGAATRRGDDAAAGRNESGRYAGGGYRTMCVRLCDGFYFPVSFATTRERFARDEDVCQSACSGSQARLFVYQNPGEEIDDMRDRDGFLYRDLRSSFLFKTTYDAACKCKPDAWERTVQQRHRTYAAQSVRRSERNVSAATGSSSGWAPPAAALAAHLAPVVTDVTPTDSYETLAQVPAGPAGANASQPAALVVVNGPEAVRLARNKAQEERVKAEAAKRQAQAALAAATGSVAVHQRVSVSVPLPQRPSEAALERQASPPDASPEAITAAAEITATESESPRPVRKVASSNLNSGVMRLGADGASRRSSARASKPAPVRIQRGGSDWRSRALFAD